MLSDNGAENVFGKLAGPSINTSILRVVTFVESHLEKFSCQYAGSAIKNEKGLTQELCKLLNLYAHNGYYPFWFEKDDMEKPERGDSPSVDIAVISSQYGGITIETKSYSNRESFFSMEAKRLCKISKAREKEYLVGRVENGEYKDCGGVERFKKEIHGKGLKYGAIIGYVQEHDFNYWHKTINAWIDEFINDKIERLIKWTEKDKLVEDYKQSVKARFKSENSRTKGTILLFHLWVSLVKCKA